MPPLKPSITEIDWSLRSGVTCAVADRQTIVDSGQLRVFPPKTVILTFHVNICIVQVLISQRAFVSVSIKDSYQTGNLLDLLDMYSD